MKYQLTAFSILVCFLLNLNFLSAQDAFFQNKDWFENPNKGAYIFSPTAFNLKKGEGYYKNTMLVLNGVGYGITDNFSIEGSAFLLGLLSADDDAFFFAISPKATFPIDEDIRIGAGATIFGANGESLVFLYGTSTFGSPNANVSINIGPAFGNSEMVLSASISGQLRFIKNLALITENWYFTANDDSTSIYSVGLRVLAKKFALDLMYVSLPDVFLDDNDRTRFSIPFATIKFPFGRN